MNRATIIGNLTKDPELKVTPNGVSVCTFTVAVQRKFKDQNGERQADFIPVVTWRGLAENCGKYLAKGKKAAISGAITTRTYTAQDGSKRYITEVVADDVEFLTPTQGGTNYADPQQGFEEYTSITDDELPF